MEEAAGEGVMAGAEERAVGGTEERAAERAAGVTEEGAAGRAAEGAAGDAAGGAEEPQRVSTLELFFDLVFVFAITQLTGVLARDLTLAAAARVLLIFGVLWWMYGGYVWLSNARPPVRTPERLLLLCGMAGFLIVGLAIPGAFGRDGVALGLGYLLLVAVHAWLYHRVNANILRVVPFNLAAALLIIGAGLAGGAAAYGLWLAALAVLVVSPLIFPVRGRFAVRPDHFAERHGALVIIVFGESVADIGIGTEGHAITVSLVVSAVLGLALAAALWWSYFGVGDDENAERALRRADPAARPALALAAFFYAYIPILLGIVTLAAALKRAIGQAGATLPYPACLALGGGVALYLAGDAAFRRVLRIGGQRSRILAAAASLAVSAVGVTISVAAEIALLALIVAAALLNRRRPDSVKA
jgi:low temperature requirement protein LtrA